MMVLLLFFLCWLTKPICLRKLVKWHPKMPNNRTLPLINKNCFIIPLHFCNYYFRFIPERRIPVHFIFHNNSMSNMTNDSVLRLKILCITTITRFARFYLNFIIAHVLAIQQHLLLCGCIERCQCICNLR
jgi:hypothetical protein